VTPPPRPRSSTALRFSLAAGAAALLAGLALRALIVLLRDSGPVWEGVSLRGNGAAVLLVPAAAALVAAEVLCARRRAWLGMVLVPLAFTSGLFLLAGGI
jgi:hypothetical protein